MSDDGMRLADRQQILDVVARYCRAVDRRDFDLLRDCYHPDAVHHHAGFTGGVEDYISWVRTGLEHYPHTHHLIGQQLVDFDGETARSETYGTAAHWSGPDGDPSRDYTTGFRYIDRFERRDGKWRVAERLAVRDWTAKAEGQFVPPPAPGPVSAASREDSLYRLPGWDASSRGLLRRS